MLNCPSYRDSLHNFNDVFTNPKEVIVADRQRKQGFGEIDYLLLEFVEIILEHKYEN